MTEFQELGVARSVELIRDRVSDAPAYITFDFDCLDPSVAPGSRRGTRIAPETDGLLGFEPTVWQAYAIVLDR